MLYKVQRRSSAYHATWRDLTEPAPFKETFENLVKEWAKAPYDLGDYVFQDGIHYMTYFREIDQFFVVDRIVES